MRMKCRTFMRGTVIRDDVAPVWSKCKSCGVGTRSHTLEPAEYEIYRQEVIVGQSDEFAADQWEDVEEVEKYEMVIEPVVMCHRCWTDLQEKFVKRVNKNYQKWLDGVIEHQVAIRKTINTQVYYDFKNEEATSKLKNLAKKLKESALDG